jgi:hypothetical protein
VQVFEDLFIDQLLENIFSFKLYPSSSIKKLIFFFKKNRMKLENLLEFVLKKE